MIKSNDFGFHHIFVHSSYSYTNSSNNKKEYDDANKKLTLGRLHVTGGKKKILILLWKKN